jgi:hypothetical protein
MPDEDRTYTSEEFERAVEAEVKRLRAEEREAARGVRTYSEDDFNAEKQKRLDLTARHGRRELIKRVQVRGDVGHVEAYKIAEPFFKRLAPREDGDVDVTLGSGGVLSAGFNTGTGWSPIDQLASEAVMAAVRNEPGRQALEDKLVEKKRRSSVFRSGLI